MTREEAIKIIEVAKAEVEWNYPMDYYVAFDMAIEALKQPERPTGRWIHDGYNHLHGVDWMHCSVCGRREPYVHAAMTDYCSGCGAKMEVEHETQNT